MMRFNELQEYYKKVLEQKRIKAKKEGLVVSFFVTQKQLWCASSVYEELCKIEFIRPQIVAFPNIENKVDSFAFTCKSNYDFFKSKNMNVVYGYDIKEEKYLPFDEIGGDIVFYDQPFKVLPNELCFKTLCLNTLICYIPYGYKIAGFLQLHFNHELINSCWKVFAESSWHKEQFCKIGAVGGKNAVISGYPKLDAYVSKKKPKQDLWKKSHEENIKKVIWAPHWSIDSIDYSTFTWNYKYFLDLAKNNKHITWVFKPHQKLKHYLVERNFLSKDEVEQYYGAWNDLDNGFYYDDSDYFDIFKTSNAMITDCGSFLAEYLPTKNPIIHLINPKSKGYNEIGKEIINTYYKAHNLDELKNFIEEVVLKENDYKKEQRLEKLHLVVPNENGAGAFIANYIKKELS